MAEPGEVRVCVQILWDKTGGRNFHDFSFQTPLSICKAFRVPARTVAFQVLFFQNACGSKVHFSWLFFALKQASFLLETDG